MPREMTRTERALLSRMSDDWSDEGEEWKANRVFHRLYDRSLVDFRSHRVAGGDVTTGPGSWGHYTWQTRRTLAGRAALAQEDRNG